ncbi:hypothetical protein L0F63_003113 [Massospora cicadina]|nr:hypothetical protein L0F63_003113 [Massospora cicadina]
MTSMTANTIFHSTQPLIKTKTCELCEEHTLYVAPSWGEEEDDGSDTTSSGDLGSHEPFSLDFNYHRVPPLLTPSSLRTFASSEAVNFNSKSPKSFARHRRTNSSPNSHSFAEFDLFEGGAILTPYVPQPEGSGNGIPAARRCSVTEFASASRPFVSGSMPDPGSSSSDRIPAPDLSGIPDPGSSFSDLTPAPDLSVSDSIHAPITESVSEPDPSTPEHINPQVAELAPPLATAEELSAPEPACGPPEPTQKNPEAIPPKPEICPLGNCPESSTFSPPRASYYPDPSPNPAASMLPQPDVVDPKLPLPQPKPKHPKMSKLRRMIKSIIF